jgi:hypothetical protein
MKDTLGIDLEPGDLVADIRTGYHWNSIGIVHGGITNGGRIRYISHGGYKGNSQEKCLIKITPETFVNVHERKLNELRGHRDREDDFNDEWYSKQIKAVEDGIVEIAKMRKQYGKEF